MNPEEYLDRLIEKHERGELYVHAINDDVAASIGAAEALAQLKEVQIPYEFANNLELSIRARARNLTEQNHWNIPVAQSHSLTGLNGWNIPPVQSGNQAGSRRIIKHRAWVNLLRIAAVFIIAAVGVLTASARSLPGDALYSLKQAEIQFTSTFSGVSQNSANLQINQLRNAIADLKTVVNDGRNDDAIRLALETVAAKTSDSQEAIAALPEDPARDEAQRSLASALTEEDQILHQLLNNVDWPIRLTFTQQLGTLGEPVLTVTNVVVRPQSNGTLLILVTGTHFAPQAQLMIDGRQNGVVSRSTPTQLAAVLSSAAWPSGAYAIGVRNPDGTAAQLIINSDDDNNPDRGGSNHNRQGTPVPYPTGRPDE